MTARMRGGTASVVLLVGLLGGCASTQSPAAETNVGYEAGDGSFTTWRPQERTGPIELSGPTYHEEQVDLADWRGDVVVVNFWYAACPPCRAEADDLVAIYEEYRDQGVRFLGVNPRDDAGTALAFERTFGVTYPSLHDAQARGVAAMEGLVPLQAVPTTVVLDAEGRVAARVLGQVDPQTLRGLVDDTLAEA